MRALNNVFRQLKELARLAEEDVLNHAEISKRLDGHTSALKELQDAAGKSADADEVLAQEFASVRRETQELHREVRGLISLTRNQSSEYAKTVSRLSARVETLERSVDAKDVVPGNNGQR